jgi:hypothetical protein
VGIETVLRSSIGEFPRPKLSAGLEGDFSWSCEQEMASERLRTSLANACDLAEWFLERRIGRESEEGVRGQSPRN